MFKQIAMATTAVLIAGTASAEVIFTVSDQRPDNAARALSTTNGTVSAPAALPTMTYTITGLDLTSVGGTASETIIYDVLFTQTGGTDVQFNTFGNLSVTGGASNDQIDPTESLMATVSLSSTTFTGDIDLGIIFLAAGGNNNEPDAWDVIHEGGTISRTDESSPLNATFAPSSFVTLDTTGGAVNFQRFDVQVTAIPEPGSLALLALGSMLVARRRRA